jgi:carbonic anhydrase
MKGALKPEDLTEFPHVREWLGYTRAATLVVQQMKGDISEEQRLDLLIKQNVLLQIAHLRTHPYVAAHLATGDVQIHGWVYDIKTGDVLAFDDDAGEFIPVADHYKDSVSAVIHAHHKDHDH